MNSKNIQKQSQKDLFLVILDERDIPYGSCGIVYNLTSEKKELNFFGKGWKSEYDSNMNGIFIPLGENSDINVLDLDNLENPICKKLKILADECCNLKVKTRKGYHYYFIFDEELNYSRHMKKYDFDYLANDSIVLCPPSYYDLNENEKFVYTLISAPEKNKLINKMSTELKYELKKLFCDNNLKDKAKEIEKIIKKEQKNFEKKKIIYNRLTKEEMEELLEKLSFSGQMNILIG